MFLKYNDFSKRVFICYAKCMSFIYITGPSGAGKSTVRNELLKRGFEAHDTDEDGISSWYNIESGEKVERPDESERDETWYQNHIYKMSAYRIQQLALSAKNKLIFLCGNPSNDIEFMDKFDKVLCLNVDVNTVKKRIINRTTNEFGKSPDELALILHWHQKIIDRYASIGATMIDATKPLNDVMHIILTQANQASTVSHKTTKD